MASTKLLLTYRVIIVYELMSICMLLYFVLSPSEELESTTVSNSSHFADPSPWQDRPLSDIALLNSYLTRIESASKEFYKEIYTVTPSIVWYQVSVKELTADKDELNPVVTITFEVAPFLGAHNIVGYDEVTFLSSYTGEIKLVEYKQIKSFELPEHLKDLRKSH